MKICIVPGNLACPTIILTGSEDGSHERTFALKARLPNCELKVLPGAGHACQMEQPWLVDPFMIEFLTKQACFPQHRSRLGSGNPLKVLIPGTHY